LDGTVDRINRLEDSSEERMLLSNLLNEPRERRSFIEERGVPTISSS
jgi:hypothetical protein